MTLSHLMSTDTIVGTSTLTRVKSSKQTQSGTDLPDPSTHTLVNESAEESIHSDEDIAQENRLFAPDNEKIRHWSFSEQTSGR